MYFIIKNSILQLTDVVKIAVEWKLNYLKDVYDIENNCNNVYNQNIESKDMYLTTIEITNDDIKNIERDYNHVDQNEQKNQKKIS